MVIVISYILRPGVSTMIFAMCLTSWLQTARLVRNQVLIIRDRDYNLASRCLGTATWRIMAKNLLPYLVSILTLRMALAIPAAIGNEVFITYIGLGVPLEIPTLGNLIKAGQTVMMESTLSYQLSSRSSSCPSSPSRSTSWATPSRMPPIPRITSSKGGHIMETETILSVRDLDVKFTLRGQVLHAIRGISLDVHRGESLAIVGESGSGKSVFTKTFMGLLDSNGSVTAGEIRYNGQDLAGYTTDQQWRTIRGREIAMVMQDPMTSLNPLKTIGDQIEEAIVLHQGLKGAEAHAQVLQVLEEVGIDQPERRSKQYPHEFSGGMRQRVVIAIAVACRPKILICDEPTTALDVTIQAQILQLIKDLQKKYDLTTIYITHDLGVVANVADRIAVMYAGDIVEIGTCEEVFYDPRHPYTWALLSSLPQLGVKGEELYSIKGTPPNLFLEVKGDAFAPRNPHALKIDFVERPPYFEVSPTHKARTWLLDPRAPKVEPPEHIKHLREQGVNRHV